MSRVRARLDQIDAWGAEAVLRGAESTAADDRIASSVGLLLRVEDLIQLIGSPGVRAAGSRTIRAAIPRRGCRFTESFSVLKSAAGIPLWRFAVRKYWCWNRDRRAVDAKPQVFVDVSVPQSRRVLPDGAMTVLIPLLSVK